MSRQIRVSIDGNHLPNVLDVRYGLECQRDTNGAPVDARPRMKRIVITRRSDESTDLWAWALKPHQEYFKTGRIEFLDPKKEDVVLKTVEWTDGFVSCFSEEVPHVNDRKDRPQVERLEISAASIESNGVSWQAVDSESQS